MMTCPNGTTLFTYDNRPNSMRYHHLTFIVIFFFLTLPACKSHRENPLSFWIVSDSKTESSRYIDTATLPNVGFIKDKPDLVISKIRRVSSGRIGSSSGSSNQANAPILTVAIEFFPPDDERMWHLTRTNSGRRVLIMLGNRPIWAPIITMPLTNGFQIVVADTNQLAGFQRDLDGLLVPQ